MNRKTHFKLVLIVISAWLAYYLIGLPSNYYQEWSTADQILLSLVSAFAVLPFIAFATMTLIGHDYVKIGVWLAFYASVPLAIIDYIIAGIIQKNGIHVFISHWYITIGYFYVWIILPLFGYLLVRLKQQLRN